jgi:transposase
MDTMLRQRQLDARAVRERMYRAPTPRGRERWHAIWLLTRGWSAAQVAEALERDAHTIGDWLAASREQGPAGLAFEQTGGPPPVLSATEQTELKAAVQDTPRAAGIDLANWNGKVVRLFVEQHFGRKLCRSSCVNDLHRLGFVLKRPKKRLLKANAERRDAFVAAYAELRTEAQSTGAQIFFVDEAHFRADADLRAKWVLRGEPALVDSTSPKLGEKATYYSGICLETGEVESMRVTSNCTAETSTAFLRQLRAKHTEPLIVIGDNSPAHRGPEIRAYLATPDLKLRLVALPAYSPDFNSDEAIWDWAREEVTANTCFGTAAKVQEKMDRFFAILDERAAEVQRHCRTILQAQADALTATANQLLGQTDHVDLTLVSV